VIGFAVRLAWRETRGAGRQLALLFACVAIGVGALVGVGSFADNLDRTLTREAKALLGGDLEIRSVRPLEGAAEEPLARAVAAGAAVTRVRELVTMARDPRSGRTIVVELKAVEGGYPLYGEIQTEPAAPLATLLGDGTALVQEELLTRLSVRPGDRLTIGAATFTIAGIVRKEPDRVGLVSLGPRVLVAAGALPATGLVTVGSRVRYRALVRLHESADTHARREALAREIDDPAIRVVSYDEAQPGLRKFYTQLGAYLGLVGLVSLLVGGIGVASAVRTLVRRRLPTIAVLKVIGAPARAIVAAYLLQTQALGLAGSAAGVVLGVAVQPLLIGLLAGLVPFALTPRVEPGTIVRGVLMGTLAALLFTLWPLLEVRAVRPSRIVRRDLEPAGSPRRRPWLAALPIVAALVALAVWQAGSLKVGLIFVGACAVALVLLAGLGRGVVGLARRLPRVPSLAWRHGVANLKRPGAPATGVVVALGVGVMLLVAVALLEAQLDRSIDHEQKRQAPSFFFIDVQADQRGALAEVVSAATGGTPPELTPVVRARLAAIDGRPVTRAMIDARGKQEGSFYLTREYVLTAMAEPPRGNTITRGRWWTAAEAAARPRISVEQEAATALGVKPGSTLAFDVQGVRVEADVLSVRKVDWQSLTTNFFVIFSPGALDGAPTSYVATARVPAASEPGLQDAVVAALPNVTAIPVRDILERVSGILGRIALAVRLIALFSIGAGLLVMAATLTASRYQRLYESVILRMLGASRGAVARIFAVEYACLGAAAGLGGSVLAAALAWGVGKWVFEVPWTFEPATLALGVGFATAVALAVGFLATFRMLGQKPLPVLRQE
jgi:putative ABC transport system permease protein